MINIDKIVKKINKKFGVSKIDTAIIVGSGLIESVPKLNNQIIIPYDKIGLPKSKVSGHSGKLIVGEYNGKIIASVSRIHFYESGNMELVRAPFEIIKKLNTKLVVLLTSSGGLNKQYKVGDIMVIKDHINFTGFNPLIGIEKLEFTPMQNCYDNDITNKIIQIAKENNVPIQLGTHIQFSGPSYETKAEVNVARFIGGDTVSMSTAFDCIICNYLKMKVCGISSVVNTFEKNTEELSHKEVLENAQKAIEKIKILLSNLIGE